MGAVRLLFLGGSRLNRALRLTGFGKIVIAARIKRELFALQMQDMADRPVEQLTVMGNEQHRMGVFRQIGLQPQRALKVEIVCRLIKQQEIRLGKKHACERDPHAPSAGKSRAGHVDFLGGKAKPAQDRCGTALSRPGVDIGEPGLNFGDPVRVCRAL